MLTRDEVVANAFVLTRMIRDALHYRFMDCPVERVFSMVDEDLYQLWGVLERLDNNLVGMFITALHQRPLTKVCRVEMLAGDNMLQWIGHSMEQIDSFALIHRCDRMEFDGRAGWGKVLAPYGVKECYRVFSKPMARC